MKKKKNYNNLKCYASEPIAEKGKKPAKKVKRYKKSKKNFLAELRIDYIPHKKADKRKRHSTQKPPQITEKLKEAFIPLNKTHKIKQTVLINPNQRNILSITNRRWRSFIMAQGAVARCGMCGKIISSGYKSCDDYICSFCRYSKCGSFRSKKSKGDKCSYSVWTISR